MYISLKPHFIKVMGIFMLLFTMCDDAADLG